MAFVGPQVHRALAVLAYKSPIPFILYCQVVLQPTSPFTFTQYLQFGGVQGFDRIMAALDKIIDKQ